MDHLLKGSALDSPCGNRQIQVDYLTERLYALLKTKQRVLDPKGRAFFVYNYPIFRVTLYSDKTSLKD